MVWKGSLKLAFELQSRGLMGLVDWASLSPGISPRLARIHPSYNLACLGAAATEAPHDPEGQPC